MSIVSRAVLLVFIEIVRSQIIKIPEKELVIGWCQCPEKDCLIIWREIAK